MIAEEGPEEALQVGAMGAVGVEVVHLTVEITVMEEIVVHTIIDPVVDGMLIGKEIQEKRSIDTKKKDMIEIENEENVDLMTPVNAMREKKLADLR